MNSKAFFLLFFTISLLLTSRAQERAPHGLAYENPVAFSPSAVEFFHPKTQKPETKNPCTESTGCSPFPLAAQVEVNEEQQSLLSTSQKDGNSRSSRLGAGGIAGIVVGLAFAVVITMAGLYVFITRRANEDRATNSKSVQPDA